MEYLMNRPISSLLILLGFGLISLGIRFRKVCLIEEGENVSPAYFTTLRFGICFVGAILIGVNFNTFGGFLIQVMFGMFRTTDRLLGTIIYLAAIGLVWYWVGQIGIVLRRKKTDGRVDAFFDRDEVVAKLLRDVENGAKTVLLFKNRMEGIRSFSFDVDGYNHALFSAIGCKELARYIVRKSGVNYSIQICSGYAGEGGGSSSASGFFSFSHINMERQ